MQTLWQNEQDRLTLLKQLVNHQSITNTQGEKTFPNLVNQLLFQLKYFKTNPNQIQKILTDDDKEVLIAFYQGSQSGKLLYLLVIMIRSMCRNLV